MNLPLIKFYVFIIVFFLKTVSMSEMTHTNIFLEYSFNKHFSIWLKIHKKTFRKFKIQ